MKTALWVDSTHTETEPYRAQLRKFHPGLVFNVFDCAYDAVEGLESPSDAVFLKPQHLSYGLHAIDQRHEDAPRDVHNPYNFGLWVYERLRKSPNADRPLFLFTFGISRKGAIGDHLRLGEAMEGHPNVTLVDLITVLPGEFAEIINQKLSR